ncbi:MAG: hypothetical protein HQM10_26730 [Candidatus Riflebacteria bacterium]|nr:hypothetical protein [Candidatus Riflebacteria bacterium]
MKTKNKRKPAGLITLPKSESLQNKSSNEPWSLKDYDSERFGPFFGISDDGSSAKDIVRAAFSSPKAKALKNHTPQELGIDLDAERLVAIGEVVAGPDELQTIRQECSGKILNSMNVGSRVNQRYFKTIPPLFIPGLNKTAMQSLRASLWSLKKLIQPFLNSKVSRTILVEFKFQDQVEEDRIFVLNGLKEWMKENSPHLSLGLLVNIDERVTKNMRLTRKNTAKKGMDLAKKAEIKEVAITGMPRLASAERVSMPGMLQYFCAQDFVMLFDYANSKGIKTLRPFNYVDTETIARHIWQGLNSAKIFGLELGKYGLYPLTFNESSHVVEQIQQWFKDWTPAPVFYVDVESIGDKVVYTKNKSIRNPMKRSQKQGACDWLKMVGKLGTKVVLIDTVEKAKKMRILKNSDDDEDGIFQIEDVKEINSVGKEFGIKILWAGGITREQAYHFGKAQVFGIFVTSAVSIEIPVRDETRDIALTQRKKPNFSEILKAQCALDAGFLGLPIDSSPERIKNAWKDHLERNGKTRR